MDVSSYERRCTQIESTTACPFRYQGQYEDTATGLYYNHFRYYSPEDGLCLSQGPIRIRGGLALYSYVHDSTTWVDPFGLAPGPGLITYPVSASPTPPLPGSRTTGIDRAWVSEKQLVTETGMGTRTWTQAEIDLIKNTPNGNLISAVSNAGYTGITLIP